LDEADAMTKDAQFALRRGFSAAHSFPFGPYIIIIFIKSIYSAPYCSY
jgi:hypothetical protein